MIRLGITRSPRVIELAAGVTITVKPLTFSLYRAAVYSAERQATQIAREAGVVEAAGGTIIDIPDAHDREGILGLRDLFMVQALARHAVIDWSGIGGPDGTPVPVTPSAVDELMRDHPLLTVRFETEYLREIAEVAAEGNGSGSGLNGTSDPEPNTAGAAEKPIFPVRAEHGGQTANSVPQESMPL